MTNEIVPIITAYLTHACITYFKLLPSSYYHTPRCLPLSLPPSPGIVEGAGFGYNPTAMLVTRGCSEMKKLAVALGARPETLSGLSGIGTFRRYDDGCPLQTDALTVGAMIDPYVHKVHSLTFFPSPSLSSVAPFIAHCR